MDFSKFNQVNSDSPSNVGDIRPKLKTVSWPKFPRVFSLIDLKKFPPKRFALTSVIVAVVAAGILIALSQFGKSATFTQNTTAEIPIARSFQFPILDENGNPAENFVTMNLITAAKMKNILIQGKPATAREGKIFLIVNLEVVNDYRQKINITPVDLVRLIDASGKKFAPDVHNEAVAVEPISVKKTRVGFVVDDGSTGFNLQVGEINGPKETISLAL